MKKAVATLYILVMVVMAIATIVEKYEGTMFVHTHIYGAWWFVLLWALLAAAGIFYFLKRRVKRVSTVALHASFVLILLGALLTHLTAYQGTIHLRINEQVNTCMDRHQLPFVLKLQKFNIHYHEGTRAEADYETVFLIDDKEEGRVSMNNIYSHRGYRFYQSSFDPDLLGSYLAVNSDPWGIPVTYTGYGLLFFSLIWMLIDPKGTYRKLWKSVAVTSQAKTIILAIMLLSPFSTLYSPLHAAPVLPKETAERFGQLSIVYNDRVCPLQTYAIDFTKKLYGKPHYGDYTAEQVLTGFIFFGDQWNKEPIVRIKGGDLKDALQLPGHVSVNQFFNNSMGGYILGPYIEEYYQGMRMDGFHKQAAKIDDQLQMVMELQHGTPLKVFPHTDSNGSTVWYGPTDEIPATVDSLDRQYMQQVFSLLNEEIQKGNWGKTNELLDKMLKYQQKNGGESLQTTTAFNAERFYNRIPFATILFMVCLTLGFVSLLKWRFVRYVCFGLLVVSFLALTLCLVLRWIIVEHVPMSNGYETMLLLAWFIQLLTLFATRRFPIALTFGLLLSGFFLLVSHISLMDPQMTHMMPVLQSPLLSLHVSIIMMAYALVSLTFMCGITGLIRKKQAQQLQLLSQLFLYPALTCLGIGIFLGAIWANISWGTYWSWDPKETWALITFMIYGIGVHSKSFSWLQQPKHYHLYMTLAFLTILMTYFGVNYILGGMHSYA